MYPNRHVSKTPILHFFIFFILTSQRVSIFPQKMFDTPVIRTNDVPPSIYPHAANPQTKTKTTTNIHQIQHNDSTDTHVLTRTTTPTPTFHYAANFCIFSFLLLSGDTHSIYKQTETFHSSQFAFHQLS